MLVGLVEKQTVETLKILAIFHMMKKLVLSWIKIKIPVTTRENQP